MHSVLPMFEDWSYQREEDIPLFQYWSIILELELLLHIYVCSLWEVSFNMYLDGLKELAAWFHALNHTNYARWIPVHLKDMAELPERHPEITGKFRECSFTVHQRSSHQSQSTKHMSRIMPASKEMGVLLASLSCPLTLDDCWT